MINNYQKGVSVYLAIVILTILMAVILGLATITIGQLKITTALGQAVIAFYAADSGIEEMLPEMESPAPGYSGYLDLNNNGSQDSDDAVWQVTVRAAGGVGCEALNFCVVSTGAFRQTKRAIEITY